MSKKSFEYDKKTDVVTIEGVRFHMSFFVQLGICVDNAIAEERDLYLLVSPTIRDGAKTGGIDIQRLTIPSVDNRRLLRGYLVRDVYHPLWKIHGDTTLRGKNGRGCQSNSLHRFAQSVSEFEHDGVWLRLNRLDFFARTFRNVEGVPYIRFRLAGRQSRVYLILHTRGDSVAIK